MPFEVRPTETVVINISDAGPEDALQIETKDPRFTFFCTIGQASRYKHLGLVREAVPGPIRDAAFKAARELIGSCAKSDSAAKTLQEWLEAQPDADDGLLRVVVSRLLATATVRGGRTVHDELNIGMRFTVQFSDQEILPTAVGGRIRDDHLWLSPGTIVAIEPVPRFVAEMYAASRY
jgi:translation initiation factor IF-1